MAARKAGWSALFLSIFVLSWVANSPILPAAAPATQKTEPDLTDAQARLKKFFRSKVDKGGNEVIAVARAEPGFNGERWGGLTALVGWGGSHAGLRSIDLNDNFAWQDANGQSTYALVFRLWLRAKFHPKVFAQQNKADVHALLLRAIDNGPDKGLLKAHSNLPAIDRPDLEVTAFCVVAMAEAVRAECEVPSEFWNVTSEAIRRNQLRDGSWPARAGGNVSDPIATAACLEALSVAGAERRRSDRFDRGRGMPDDPAVINGLAWVDASVNKYLDDAEGIWHLFRLGREYGRKRFGNIDWYAAGRDWILAHQDADGSIGKPDGKRNPLSIPYSAYAAQFIAETRQQYWVGKLKYKTDVPNGWNERPDDLRYFSQWFGRYLCDYDKPWHVVELSLHTDDLYDAPVLLISGPAAFKFDDVLVGQLRSYVEEGGLLVGNADGGSKAFADSFVALGAALFPQRNFRLLPKMHVYYTEQFSIGRTGSTPAIEAMSNGSRELMVLIRTDDIARRWQTSSEKRSPNDFRVFGNIQLGIMLPNMGLSRESQGRRMADPAIRDKKQLTVGRIDVGANPDPEPGAWRRLAVTMHNADAIDLQVKPIRIEKGQFRGVTIAHLAGTTEFKLTDAERAELKAFVAGGGTLIIEAVGGSNAFAVAAVTELSAIFGGNPPNLGSVVPVDDPIYKQPGAEVGRQRMTRYAVSTLGQKPSLRVIQVGNRNAVYYSPIDLSTALTGVSPPPVVGYEPETAMKLMRAIVRDVAK